MNSLKSAAGAGPTLRGEVKRLPGNSPKQSLSPAKRKSPIAFHKFDLGFTFGLQPAVIRAEFGNGELNGKLIVVPTPRRT
jgi:hypothetical protein